MQLKNGAGYSTIWETMIQYMHNYVGAMLKNYAKGIEGKVDEKGDNKPGVMAYTCNSSQEECKFQTSLGWSFKEKKKRRQRSKSKMSFWIKVWLLFIMYKIMSLKEKWSELNQPHLSLLVPFTLCV
jgi:hypothetical protein